MSLPRVFHTFVALLITCLLASASVNAETDFNTLIVFGDSRPREMPFREVLKDGQ